MNNKSWIFKSKLLTNLFVLLSGGVTITQGPYRVVDLIHRFGGEEYTDKELKEEIASVAYNYGTYGFHVDEYFIYDVKAMSDLGKKRFITEETRWGYYKKLNKDENLHFFDNKEETYELYKNYYKRELVVITEENDWYKYDTFTQKHKKVILKPRDSSGGKGVRFLRENDSLDMLLKEFKTGFIMEPVVKNCDELASFHSQSLNTVRVATIRMENRVEIAFAFFRIGRNESNIDNAAAGGIICNVDIDTGIIYAAIDEHAKKYIIHPNSGKTFLGYKIPQWDELKDLVKELAMVLPSNRYTGWDMALTDKGWIVIEANARGQFLCQMAAGEGIKKKFDDYLAELEG